MNLRSPSDIAPPVDLQLLHVKTMIQLCLIEQCGVLTSSLVGDIVSEKNILNLHMVWCSGCWYD